MAILNERERRLLSRGRIPAEPFLSVIEPELQDWAFYHNGNTQYDKSPITVIAERAKVGKDFLLKLVDRTYGSLSFDKADLVLCSMHLNQHWYALPLSEYYWKVNLSYTPRTSYITPEKAVASRKRSKEMMASGEQCKRGHFFSDFGT